MHHISQKITYIFLFLLLIVVLFHEHFKIVFAGIAIFIIGMFFIEEGFKKLSGGILERILRNFTSTTAKSVLTGMFSTSIVQSSSLVSVLVISFLGAGLIGLHGAIGVIFGSNIGTTATVWIVSAVGLKLDIAYYALPMISLGVALRFMKSSNFAIGLGGVLIGLGFIFLGISYMKDGFDVLSQNVDVASYWVDGYMGILLYVLLGFVVTIIVQSSTASMALVVTALLSGQIIYIAAVAFAIGTNIGTTVTAALGAIGGSNDGKRLALAHFLFNTTTAVVAIVLIYPLIYIVDRFAMFVSIDSYTMKLAIFHTLFNIIGLLIFIPLIQRLEVFLSQIFISVKQQKTEPKFLTQAASLHPASAIIALRQELESLLDISIKTIVNRLVYNGANKKQIDSYQKSIGHLRDKIDKSVDVFYKNDIKPIYGEIIQFSTLAQNDMSEQDRHIAYKLKVMSRELVSSLKHFAMLEKSKTKYMNYNSSEIEKHYEYLNQMIIVGVVAIENIKENQENIDLIFKNGQKELDSIDNQCNINNAQMIKNQVVTVEIASSLMNDTGFVLEAMRELLNVAAYIYLPDDLASNNEDKKI